MRDELKTPIADMHCHYPMRLLGEGGRDPVMREMARMRKRRRWARWKAVVLWLAAHLINFRNLFDSWRVDLGRLEAGGVRLVYSALYRPDDEMDVGEWPHGPPEDNYFDDLKAQMEEVEEDLSGRGTDGPVLVTSAADLEGAEEDGRVRFVHCVEGGFHLGGSAAEIEGRVAELAKHGVAYITLAHLFWRQVATNAPALPFLTDAGYARLFPQPAGLGLGELGRVAVRAMHRHRIMVDVSHMSEAAIADVFALLAELDEEHGTAATDYPAIATHAGYRFGEQEYMLSEETIRMIAARDGVVGLIMAHHQLNDGIFRSRRGPSRTLTSFRAHVDAIERVTGSHRHVAIGSDLDGFIKPTVGGIEYADDLRRLVAPLQAAYPEDAAGILHGNALRVLERALDRPAY